MYPNQWVLMRDAQFITGNLTNAIVVFGSSDRQAVHDFYSANEASLPNRICTRYTGVPVDDIEYNVEVELSEEAAY